MAEVEVRPAEPDDAVTLGVVAQRAIRISAAPWYPAEHLETWASAFSGDLVLRALERSAMLVATRNERAAGFASLLETSGDRAELSLLYVDPDFARQGVARELVGAVEEAARSRAVDEIWVDASLPALAVLEGLGYQLRQRYRKEFHGLLYDNAWLSKQL